MNSRNEQFPAIDSVDESENSILGFIYYFISHRLQELSLIRELFC